MERNIKSAHEGFAIYENEGTIRYLSYAPVGIRDWSLAAVATDHTLETQFATIKNYTVQLVISVFFVVLLIAIFIIVVSTKAHKETQRLLQKLAETDSLTLLNNRPALERRIKSFLAEDGCSQEVKTSASIGIALYDQDGQDFHALYHNADIALYRCKNGGKDQYLFFDQEDGK